MINNEMKNPNNIDITSTGIAVWNIKGNFIQTVTPQEAKLLVKVEFAVLVTTQDIKMI